MTGMDEMGAALRLVEERIADAAANGCVCEVAFVVEAVRGEEPRVQLFHDRWCCLLRSYEGPVRMGEGGR